MIIPYRFKIIFLSFLAVFICYIDRVNISVAIIPMQEQFGWSESQVGIILGSFIPDELGLKFAIPLTFIAIIINELRKLDHLIVMIVSGLAATFFYNAPFKSYILISPLIGLFAAYLILKFKK